MLVAVAVGRSFGTAVVGHSFAVGIVAGPLEVVEEAWQLVVVVEGNFHMAAVR